MPCERNPVVMTSQAQERSDLHNRLREDGSSHAMTYLFGPQPETDEIQKLALTVGRSCLHRRRDVSCEQLVSLESPKSIPSVGVVAAAMHRQDRGREVVT